MEAWRRWPDEELCSSIGLVLSVDPIKRLEAMTHRTTRVLGTAVDYLLKHAPVRILRQIIPILIHFRVVHWQLFPWFPTICTLAQTQWTAEFDDSMPDWVSFMDNWVRDMCESALKQQNHMRDALSSLPDGMVAAVCQYSVSFHAAAVVANDMQGCPWVIPRCDDWKDTITVTIPMVNNLWVQRQWTIDVVARLYWARSVMIRSGAVASPHSFVFGRKGQRFADSSKTVDQCGFKDYVQLVLYDSQVNTCFAQSL